MQQAQSVRTTNNNASRQLIDQCQQSKHCNKKWNVFKVNNKDGVFIFNFIVNFRYSPAFIVNFEHISHLTQHEKCQNTYFILEKRMKIKFNRFQIELLFLPNISAPITPPPRPTPREYRPIKSALCPYILPVYIKGILQYFT